MGIIRQDCNFPADGDTPSTCLFICALSAKSEEIVTIPRVHEGCLTPLAQSLGVNEMQFASRHPESKQELVTGVHCLEHTR